MATVRIKDVARAAGVSVGTVSNALNRPTTVADATLTRVRAAIEATGFVPNAAAGKLRSASNRTLGLVMVDVGNPYLNEVLCSVADTVEELGYVLMLCNSDANPGREARHLRFLAEHRVAGALVQPQSLAGAQPHLDGLRASGAAVVLLDEPAVADGQCSVSADDVAGGELVGHHLVSIGRRRIVVVTVQAGVRVFDERVTGLMRAVASSPDPVTVEVVRWPGLSPEHGAAVLDDVIALAPDAVFCANDPAAMTVMRGLQAKGLSVPDDVAVVGYDDITFAALASVPLTSVRHPARELGATAARLLVDEISGGAHQHRHIVFTPELVVRESTNPSRQAPGA